MGGTGIWLAGYLGGRHGSEVRTGRDKEYYVCQPLFTSEWHTPGLWVHSYTGIGIWEVCVWVRTEGIGLQVGAGTRIRSVYVNASYVHVSLLKYYGFKVIS